MTINSINSPRALQGGGCVCAVGLQKALSKYLFDKKGTPSCLLCHLHDIIAPLLVVPGVPSGGVTSSCPAPDACARLRFRPEQNTTDQATRHTHPLSPGPGGWRSKAKASAGLGPSDASVAGVWMTILSPCPQEVGPLCVSVSPSPLLIGTPVTSQQGHPVVSCYPNYLSKDPASKCSHIQGPWGTRAPTDEPGGGGHSSAQSTGPAEEVSSVPQDG